MSQTPATRQWVDALYAKIDDGLPDQTGQDGKFLTTAAGVAQWGTPAGGGGGVTDHGALTGLADDDHPQYLTNTRGDARYSQLGHGHTIANVSGLQTALDNKLDDSQVTAFGLSLMDDADPATARTTLGLGTAATANSTSFASATHTHIIGDVTGLQTALDNKVDDSQVSTFGLSLIDDVDPATARTTLGLGTAATASSGSFAAASHTHAASDIVSGTLNTARMGSGTANSTTFLRGDNTWAVPPSGGGGASVFSTTEKDLGSKPKRSGKFTITGLSALTIGKPVNIFQAVGPYTGKGSLADEAEMDGLVVSGSVTAADTITAYWTSATSVKGNFKFNYLVGA